MSPRTFANAGQDCEIEAIDGVLYSTCDLTSIDKKQLSTQAELTEQLAALAVRLSNLEVLYSTSAAALTSRIGDVEADQITLASRLTDLEGRTDNNTDSIQANTAAHGPWHKRRQHCRQHWRPRS